MLDLDHVAIATRDEAPVLERLVRDLGGTLLAGGDGVGFRWVQVRLGDATVGMTVEVLVPWEVERFDFLGRFLDRHGPGQHHLTFKTSDLAQTLERVRAAGFHPTGVNLDSPDWKEAFLVPREAHGTVVQLAQTHADFPPLAARLAEVRAPAHHFDNEWWAAPPTARDAGEVGAVLRRVVLGSPSLPVALAFFAGVLGGSQTDAGEGWVDVAWPGGGCVRLVQDRAGGPGFRRLEGDASPHHAPGTVTLDGVDLVLD